MSSMESRIANNICPITQETISHKVCTTCCQNTFEAANLISWIETTHTCPMCRCTLFSFDLILKRQIPYSPTQFLYNSMMTRESSFKKRISESYLTGKVLIFAGKDIDLARRYLHDMDVSYAEFSGRILNKTLYNFNAGTPPILLINYLKFSAGLNVTSATTLLIFDDIPDAETLQQVIGRCQRIGRCQPLEVVRFKEITNPIP